MTDLWKIKLDKSWTYVNLIEEEFKRIVEWITEHGKTCPQPRVVIAQSSSGIGTNTTIRCDNCRTGKDVTDYDSW